MISALLWLLRNIGLTGCALLAFYVYEEGIPGASRIAFPNSVPVIGGFGLVDIPLLGDLTAGRVHTYAAEQVSLATKDMVAAGDLAAVNAKLFKAQMDAQYAREQAEVARQAEDAANQKFKETQERLDAAIAEDKGANGAVWSRDDLDWLSKH